ncbi:MAG: hypothetical protein JW932_12055 [Deltaproteobacteria bacterium]|nr:hypothetical protein [Deltaproteobacteria bacterium]
MARIKIKDLPKGEKISNETMKRIFGGASRMPAIFEGPFSTTSGIETTDLLVDPINPNLDYFKK